MKEAHDPLEQKEALLIEPREQGDVKHDIKSPQPDTNGVSESPSLPPNDHAHGELGSDEEDSGWDTESLYENLLNEESPYIYTPGKC